MSKYLGPHLREKKELEVETRKAGGIRARSKSEDARMAVYKEINKLFAVQNPLCQLCIPIQTFLKKTWLVRWRLETHHLKGRGGILLFDVRWFRSTCRQCHDWVKDNVEAARKIGVLCSKGEWNSLAAIAQKRLSVSNASPPVQTLENQQRKRFFRVRVQNMRANS